MNIYLTSKFKKAYKKLPKQIKEKAKAKEKIFRKDPFNPILETHPLHGKYRDYWAFSIDKSYRIMFQFLDATKENVAFINIGTHEIYK
jgi:addiction module RelE/StbE family toxin